MLPKGYKYLNTHCLYQADVGLICPISYEADGLTIQPFFNCSVTIQDQVIQELGAEWPVLTYEYIDKNLTCGDYLFVATNPLGLVGTVSVDRKGFLPYLGSLYITPRFRGFGQSKQLVAFAETFVKESLKFGEVRLWCEESMLDFYLPFGYVYQCYEEVEGKCIMRKLI